MLTLVQRRRSENFAAQAINDFQNETAEITGAPEPILLRSVLLVLAAMLGVALLLMNVATLERIVIASGRVVSEAATLVVQPLETSVVRAINVRPGQRVGKGEVLARLDPTFTTADLSSLRKEEERLSAEIARLQAENAGRAFDPPEAGPHFELQRAIWRSRQAEYQSRLNRAQQLIENASITIARATADARHFGERLALVSDVEEMRKELQRNQVGSRLNALLASDTRVEIARRRDEAESTARSARQDLEVQRSEREVFVQQWKSQIIRDLVERSGEYERVREELSKAELRRDMIELRAADDAVVLEVGEFSVGAVVQPGEKLITLVPADGTTFVEVDVDAADQGFLTPGQEVKLKFSAYPFIKHGMGAGILRTISADSFSQTEDKRDIAKGRLPERFYRARIDITELTLRGVPEDFRPVPGMPLMADIVVGERTILSYLLEGPLRSVNEGLREP